MAEPAPATGADPDRSRVIAAVAISVGAGLALPGAVFLVLNYLRPDLVAPMLDHPFGAVVVNVERGLVVLATLTYLLALVPRYEKRWPPVVLVVVGVVLFTLPVLFLLLFGPVVFAFMYGDVGPRPPR